MTNGQGQAVCFAFCVLCAMVGMASDTSNKAVEAKKTVIKAQWEKNDKTLAKMTNTIEEQKRQPFDWEGWDRLRKQLKEEREKGVSHRE